MLAGCSGPGPLRLHPDDLVLERAWLALQRGDLAAAQAELPRLQQPRFVERLQADLLAAQAGRAVALVDRLSAGSWLAARYDASPAVARERLVAARRAAEDEDSAAQAVLWLESARRAPSRSARLSLLATAARCSPGGLSARLAIIEELLEARRLAEAETELAALEAALAAPDERGERGVVPYDASARLRWLRRQCDAASRRFDAAVHGLIGDLQDGREVPGSLTLLGELLALSPRHADEQRVRAALAASTTTGWRLERARWRLSAALSARAGEFGLASATLDRIVPRTPEEDALAARWQARAAESWPSTSEATLEQRLDSGERMPDSAAARQLRLAREWDLAARESYADAMAGKGPSFDEFLARLDAAGAVIEGAPALAGLPRHDYGVFGQRLDTRPLAASLPEAFVLAGRALTLPSDMAWFDRVSSESRSVRDTDATSHDYTFSRVRRPRVTGYLASRGLLTTGAGIDDTVFLDLDQLELELRSAAMSPAGPPLPAFPAHGRAERLDLSEPLDVVERLWAQVAADAGEDLGELLVETLIRHESQHIADFHDFRGRGVLGKLSLLASGGLLPGSVRVEIERRAQLRALRHAPDPRLPLAQIVAALPPDERPEAGEHARAYARLAAEFVAALDAGAWPGAKSRPQEQLDPRRRLVQQLDRLSPETIAAIAASLPD